MLLSLLMVLIGGKLSNAVNEAVLFNHNADSSVVSPEEDTELSLLFQNADLDKNNLLSYDEFAAFLDAKFKYGDLYHVMDVNENDKLEYDELVYYYKQLSISHPADLFERSDHTESELKTGFEELAPGTDYNDETVAEVLANVLLFKIDTGNKGYITKTEFVDFKVKEEWAPLAANSAVITVDVFKNAFYGSNCFKVLNNLYHESEQDAAVLNAYITEIKDSHSKSDEILSAIDNELVFTAHEFDDELNNAERRRLIEPVTVFLLFYFASGAASLTAAALVGVAADHNQANPGGCYDEYNTVYELNRGLVYVKDLSVGDYVYDGNDYTKVYYMQIYNENLLVNMLDIKYGNPNNNNSITLTPTHLLYLNNAERPILSESVIIGDVLAGGDITMNQLFNDNNYTVYDIKLLSNKRPINPITMTGNLMVNDIKTSVYSRSVDEHDRLQKRGAIFRWISTNINQQLAANMVDFYYKDRKSVV